MPDTGAPWHIPYPSIVDPPDDPTQSQARAQQLADNLSTLDAVLRTADVDIPAALAGITLGNGAKSTNYRITGTQARVSVLVTAAASAPTTAFSGVVTLALPITAARSAVGSCYWNPGGASPIYRLGICLIPANTSTLTIHAIRQSDLGLVAASTVWGTAVWGTNGALVANINFPI